MIILITFAIIDINLRSEGRDEGLEGGCGSPQNGSIAGRSSSDTRTRSRGGNVAQLAKGAGLTHGALYSHFGSKEELISEAYSLAVSQTAERWLDAPLGAVITQYLSTWHRDHPGSGCPIAASISEAGRPSSDIGGQFSAGVMGFIEMFIEKSCPGEADNADTRQTAIAGIAAMVGALAISRAIKPHNAELSDEFLSTVRDCLGRSLAAAAPAEIPKP